MSPATSMFQNVDLVSMAVLPGKPTEPTEQSILSVILLLAAETAAAGLSHHASKTWGYGLQVERENEKL